MTRYLAGIVAGATLLSLHFTSITGAHAASARQHALAPQGRAAAKVSTLSSLLTTTPVTDASVTVTVDRTAKDGISQMDTGVTHEHYSLDSWGDPAAVARGKSLLQAASGYQNQHIYGWGTTNPEPSPGVYDWSTLDARVALMRSTGATPVITLCCAPDWMTSLGTNTSTYRNLAPTPQHYTDFAGLARQVALRYPDVHYFQVWNEMKGLWNDATNNWDYVAYTNLYNAVYDALKSVNPNIKVGGPYLVIEGTGSNLGDWMQKTPVTKRNMQVISYWLANKHGADFICLDRTVRDDHDTAPYTPTQILGYTAEFESIAKQIRALTPLPIWWSESYFVPGDWNYQAAGLASIMLHELRGGSAVTLLWQPQGVAGDQNNGNNHNLFSDTRVASGGQPFPLYDAFKAFHTTFGAGTQLYKATSSSPDVEVLASATAVLLINKRDTAVTVNLNGKQLTLNRYEVRVAA